MSANQIHRLCGSVLYQIYPRSFFDANGDGVGDLKGITAKLGYLRGEPDSLGVDAIWISPFYPSPMADFGYDVSDYRDIDPLFGTLADFDELLSEAHRRGLQVFIDFVPNHTSDEHEWFQESRSSLDNPKRDWYVWKNPKDGQPPNNWQSNFGGPAWTLDETTGQYYLHSFLNKQPDLNWDNPEVRDAMGHQMEFWLDKGVDGLRVDAVSWISKDPLFRDDPPPTPEDQAKGRDKHQIYSQSGPKLYDYLTFMADVVASYDNRFMITEAYPQDWDDVLEYRDFYAHVNAEVSAPFNFAGIFAPWDAESFKRYVDLFMDHLEPTYLPIFCLGNHDRSRLASRVGPESTATAAMLLLTLPGMPTLYYGDELGMTDRQILPEQIQDPFEKNVPGQGNGRDPSRTPMPWDGTDTGGFSSRASWLPLGDISSQNVTDQSNDPLSLLNTYKRLIKFRSQNPAMSCGSYQSLEIDGRVFSFVREEGKHSLLVLINFSNEIVTIAHESIRGTVKLSTKTLDESSVSGEITLYPHEGVIIQP